MDSLMLWLPLALFFVLPPLCGLIELCLKGDAALAKALKARRQVREMEIARAALSEMRSYRI